MEMCALFDVQASNRFSLSGGAQVDNEQAWRHHLASPSVSKPLGTPPNEITAAHQRERSLHNQATNSARRVSSPCKGNSRWA